MAKTKHQPAEIHAAPGPLPDAHALTLAEEREANDIEREMAFEAARALGRIEALEFSETVSARAKVEVYLELKKSKAYRAIEYRDADGNPKRISDLEEFCERYMSKSARRLQQMASDYQLLGADLYDAAERIGFRNQDYRALKALPADEQVVIKQAIESDDRDTVLSLMQELAAKHQSEKAALEARAIEAEKVAADRDRIIGEKKARVSELIDEVDAARARQANFTPEERRDYECAPLHQSIAATMAGLYQMGGAIRDLMQNGIFSDLMTEECYHAILMPIKQALNLAAHHGLHIDLASLTDGDYDPELDALMGRVTGLGEEVAA